MNSQRNGLPMVILLSPFLMDGSSAMFNFALPYFGTKLQFSDFEVGLTKGAATLPYILTCLLAGALSDRVGRRRLSVAGSLGIAICFFLVPSATGFWSLVALCACVSATQGFYWAPLQGWVGDTHSGTRLSRMLIVFNLSWSAGIMSGLFVGGHLFEVSPRTLYWTASAAAVGAATVLLAVPSGPGRSPVAPGEPALPVPPALHRRYMLAHRVANSASYFCIAIVLTYFQIRAQRDLGWSPAMASRLMFVLGGVYVVMFPLLGLWTRWHYRPQLMLAAQVLGFLGILGLGWGRSYLDLLPCLASVGLMLSVSYFSSIYYSVSSVESVGTKAGWHESVLRMGDFLGGVLGGVVAGLFSDVRMAFVLAAGVVLVAGLVCGMMLCRSPVIRVSVPEG